MSTLRPATITKIQTILENSYFTLHSFDFKIDDTGEPLFAVIFRPNPEFKFSASKLPPGTSLYPSGQKSDNGFVTIENPGTDFLEAEIVERKDFNSCVRAIDSWIQRILQDYRAINPVYQELDALRKAFEENISSKNVSDKEYFSTAEAEALKRKLDDLTGKFEEFKTQKSITDKELNEIKTEIEKMKNDVGIIPKNIWYRAAGNKILKFIGSFVSSKEGRDLLIESTKALLKG